MDLKKQTRIYIYMLHIHIPLATIYVQILCIHVPTPDTCDASIHMTPFMQYFFQRL